VGKHTHVGILKGGQWRSKNVAGEGDRGLQVGKENLVEGSEERVLIGNERER